MPPRGEAIGPRSITLLQLLQSIVAAAVGSVLAARLAASDGEPGRPGAVLAAGVLSLCASVVLSLFRVRSVVWGPVLGCALGFWTAACVVLPPFALKLAEGSFDELWLTGLPAVAGACSGLTCAVLQRLER